MNLLRRLFVVLFFLLCIPISLLAGEPRPEKPPAWQSLADSIHAGTVSSLLSLSENLDNFFPAPVEERFDYRRSRLTVQAGGQIDSNGDAAQILRMHGTLALPRTQERLSLYFSGDQEEKERPGDDGAAVPLTDNGFILPRLEETNLRFGFNTGLRFVFADSENYRTQYQIGARLLPDWDPYHEFSVLFRLSLGSVLFKPGQSLFWRNSKGYGETTRYDLDYSLNPQMLLRLHSDATYAEKSDGLEHRHALSFFHQIDPESGYTATIEARGETEPQSRMTRYLAGVTWKELIYRDWLFIETGVNVLFEQTDNFDPTPAVFVTLIGDFRAGGAQSRDSGGGVSELTPPSQPE